MDSRLRGNDGWEVGMTDCLAENHLNWNAIRQGSSIGDLDSRQWEFDIAADG